jgi:hypothetical protein
MCIVVLPLSHPQAAEKKKKSPALPSRSPVIPPSLHAHLPKFDLAGASTLAQWSPNPVIRPSEMRLRDATICGGAHRCIAPALGYSLAPRVQRFRFARVDSNGAYHHVGPTPSLKVGSRAFVSPNQPRFSTSGPPSCLNREFGRAITTTSSSIGNFSSGPE